MTKGKDPAMLFYTSDFLTGVALMGMKERGQYITLLCLQQQRGHMTKAEMQKAVGRMSEELLSKFIPDDDGKLYNRRAELEINKRAAHCQRQKDNVEKRWAKSQTANLSIPTAVDGTYPGNTTVLPLENETAIEIEKKSKLEVQRRDSGEPEGESEGEPTQDAALAELMQEYQNALGTFLSSSALEELMAYYASVGKELPLHALQVARDAGVLNWRYIRGILQDYARSGYQTLGDVYKAEQAFANSKQAARRKRRWTMAEPVPEKPVDMEKLLKIAESM